jgi:hypothetical protein
MTILTEFRIASSLILWKYFETGNGRVTPHSRQLTSYVLSPILSDVRSINHTCEWRDVTLELDNIAICLCPFQFAVHNYSAVSFEAASAIDVKSLNNWWTDYPTYVPLPPISYTAIKVVTCEYVYVCLYVCMYVYIYTHIYIYIYVYIYIYIYIYIYFSLSVYKSCYFSSDRFCVTLNNRAM